MREQRTPLFDAMKAGAVLITPNNRLSNQLLRDYIRAQGLPCMDKPRCLPYPAFLQHMFHEQRHKHPLTQHPHLLTNQQLRALLRRIITDSRAQPCNDGLLDAVLEAWTSCQHWLLENTHPAFQSSPQTRQFQDWQQTLDRQLTALDAIAESQLVRYFLASDRLPPINTLMWVCFDDYTPAQCALQAAFSAMGCQQSHEDFTHPVTQSHQIATRDTTDEYQQLIHWLKTKRAAGEQNIGVVIPDLITESTRLNRLLNRHFSSEEVNISLGSALADYPLVAHALQWIHLDLTCVSNHQARLLLHSPFLAHAQSESVPRAQVMQDSRLLQETLIPMPHLTAALNHTCPALKKALGRLTNYPESATAPVWVKQFNQRLSALGFPGDGALDSATYQCLQRLMTLFDELRELAVVTDQMTQEDAFEALVDLAKTTIFQPQKTNAPIQVLGLLEASGCTFDSLWVAGMTDQCLPQKTRLSAFIPIDLQRTLDMPHANTSRELLFATATIRRLQQGSQTSVFSYPHLHGDRPSMPSPLIRSLPLKAIERLHAPVDITRLVLRQEAYELPLSPAERATGGTSLLANQAKCPFRAFAAHRLHAKHEQAAAEGLSAMERGQLVHRILETLWQTVQTQETLLTYSAETLAKHIHEAILSALNPLMRDHPLSFHPLVQSVEVNRLTQLVHASLDWERTRPPFTIEALEHAATIELAGLDFHIKIDRLDRVASGKKWVIDYKSSLPATKPWLETRPEAPQLLLYALLDEAIHALLFVELKQGHMTCCGFSAEISPVSGIRAVGGDEHWSEHQAKWRNQLTELALEFKTGHCPPAPTRNSTCKTCEFQNLCRVAL